MLPALLTVTSMLLSSALLHAPTRPLRICMKQQSVKHADLVHTDSPVSKLPCKATKARLVTTPGKPRKKKASSTKSTAPDPFKTEREHAQSQHDELAGRRLPASECS